VSSPKDAAAQSLKEVESELTRLQSENDQLKSNVASFQRRVDSGSSRIPMVDALMRDYQSTRDVYDAAQKRFNEAQLAQRAEQGPGTREFRVLDAAVPPEQATGPARWMLISLGVLVALAAGVFALFIADRLDTTFHSLDELRTFTNVPVLASIPVLATEPWRAGRALRSAALASATAVVIAGAALTAFLVAHRCEQVVRMLSRVG
jgi:capsular polysaccharide biosynthesis protein